MKILVILVAIKHGTGQLLLTHHSHAKKSVFPYFADKGSETESDWLCSTSSEATKQISLPDPLSLQCLCYCQIIYRK